MFKQDILKQRYVSFGIVAAAIALLAVVFAFSSENVNTDSYAKASDTKVVKKHHKAKKSTAAKAATKEQPAEQAEASSADVAPDQESVASEVASPAVQEAAPQAQYAATPVAYSNGVILSNGNTAGAIGSEAAAQMAAATGVPQATWEAIIARESNGNPNAANPSGASGLFQTMPGWGSTATVQDQVNSALNAYRAQGLSAWGY
ncbi:TPA: lytic transglycosylase domain-containing protein [Streptococcus equi subsp. zooepidemicus]|uniref:transglycosylase SLT domain-containing protein n=1 Tax=Streptococcus equi TaxID=1336 RepID=UPI0002E0DCB2|nr:transglycosylase SLT domain-containing protein [Streptococcus equi]HEL0164890.1 lytic transglycosylase domain-containing protein [Streptococcus equi subsp. zooepidemicus]HEL0170958.1 lytic transglycosylase domain-containing protein [Streptococcus equi subsp. zooepidemicus]HEL0187025.1 lytic transglycosylase domain-containing protein [Streptococcus equi subsp. zooepidemicus]HEL0192945.1 lytic transglycosylase domain-containing protein [Streptococcus equi subsp. zooepidemicus]HEL0198886.1 lyt